MTTTTAATTTTRSAYTCASCHAIFAGAELHRAHYQSDWHRYNLRRKVTELPPVTETVFLQRVGQLHDAQTQPESASSGAVFSCAACVKTFSSENAYLNHVKSKRHLETAVRPQCQEQRGGAGREEGQSRGRTDGLPEQAAFFIDEDATEEEIREAIETKLALSRRLRPQDCIFCSQQGDSFEENMEHMTKVHSLYIPDLDFAADLPALVAYLADKVAVAHCCLYCPAIVQPFSGLEAVRRHMIDKGHTKIRFDEEGMEELADFYDYEDGRIGDAMSDDGDGDFVDVSDASDASDDDDNGEWTDRDGVLMISPDETELILPSGLRLGHRAYRRYYRQNLYSQICDSRSSRRSEHDRALIHRLSDYYVATGMASGEERTRHLIGQRKAVEQRKDWDIRTGTRNNALQEHFRHQLRQ